MIYVKLHGRLGNYLFELAAAATLAAQNQDEFCVVCHTDYVLSRPDSCTIREYVKNYEDTIFKNILILNDVKEVPKNSKYFRQDSFLYTPIKYTPNLLIDGGFQSYKYFDEKVVQKLFQIPPLIKEYILHKYGDLLRREITSINIRRGDYCEIPHKFPVCSRSYFTKAIKYIGTNKEYLIISDDVRWCKKNFPGSNYTFVENEEPLVDLYLQTMCKNNIISNSSFSWWGAYLNPNPSKIVICPTPWFGKSYEVINNNATDLIPPNWIQLKNSLSLKMWTKVIHALINERLIAVRDRHFKALKNYLNKVS